MKPKFLRSRPITRAIYRRLQKTISQLNEQGVTPGLAVVLIGRDPDSVLYTKIKSRKARKLGINVYRHNFRAEASIRMVKSTLRKLNCDKRVHGIVIQLPLPPKFKTDEILDLIDKQKDIDGLVTGSRFLAPAALAIIKILKKYKIKLENKYVLLIGYGRLVGKPLTVMLRKIGVKPKICDIKTKNIGLCSLRADVIISATGSKTMRPEDINAGTVVIDAAKDVDFDAIKDKTSWITPRFGGVGPLTVAILLDNLIKATTIQTRQNVKSDR